MTSQKPHKPPHQRGLQETWIDSLARARGRLARANKKKDVKAAETDIGLWTGRIMEHFS